MGPESVLRLLASDAPIVAAVGRRKTEATSWCLRLLPGSGDALNQDAMGAVEVESVGTGFMRIMRDCLKAIMRARPDLKLAGDMTTDAAIRPHYHRFFRFGDDDGGEDYEFCALWRSLGGRIRVDPEIALTHCGDAEYRGRFADALVAAPPPAASREAAD